MIYFYSATGNSHYAAHHLANLLGTKAIDILTSEVDRDLYAEKGDIGFVFPIYCWGVPPVVSRFISKLGNLPKDAYIWALCTCGDEAGIAMRLFNRQIKTATGREADALFSLIMPNTYVLLPGFNVDKKPVEERKLQEAPGRLKEVAGAIKGRKTGIYDVHEGSFPALRTRSLFPLFERWGVFPKYWKSSDACIGCGKCSRICPAHNIEMVSDRPKWGSLCFSCCACFHVCPVKAIDYGKITVGKSQYLCPLKG